MLDKILVDAADRAGAEVREQFTVEDVIVEDGTVVGIRGRGQDGTAVVERAQVVIGADGRNSRVAKAVQPAQYNDKPMLQWSYYTYWSGLPVDGFEIVVRPDRGWAAMPTNDGLTLARRRLALLRVHGVQGRRRSQLSQDPRTGPRVRRAGAHGDT